MDDIELIKERINIVDLVGEYIPLKKAGINFKANCPFHQERTPSFMVSPERGIWHCFGCAKGGDHFKFLMEKDGIEFPEALEILAKKAGVILKKTSSLKKDSNQRLFELNQKASQFYSYLLLEHPLGKKALNYLKNRGLTQKTIKDFNLGYAPQNWEVLTRFLKKRGFSLPEIIASGLGVPSKSGCYDRFRGRIIFPLMDQRGRIVGFSGRILDSGEPKYLNTPQTTIFDKSKLLFGIQLSKGDIKQKNEVIVAEGEIDMLMSYQSGIKNIVASKGTALTESQIEILRKMSDNLLLCFDADLAGDSASRRGIELSDKAGFNIKVIQVEGQKDPADLILQDPKLWQNVVESALPIYDYYLESVSKRYNLKSASSKKAVLNELLPIWSKISSSVDKEHYIEKLAAFLMVKGDFIKQELKNYQKSEQSSIKPQALTIKTVSASQKNHQKVNPPDRRSILEEYLISLLLHIPEETVYVPNFPETLIVKEDLKHLYVILVIYLDSISYKGKSFKINEFFKTLPPDLTGLVDKLYLTQIDEKLNQGKYWQKEVEEVVLQLKKMLIKSSLEKLTLQIKNAQEFEKYEQLDLLNKRFRDLSIRLKNL